MLAFSEHFWELVVTSVTTGIVTSVPVIGAVIISGRRNRHRAVTDVTAIVKKETGEQTEHLEKKISSARLSGDVPIAGNGKPPVSKEPEVRGR